MSVGKPVTPVLQKSRLTDGLVLGMPLHHGGGTTAADLSGADNTGAFGNNAGWSQGLSGPCASFDGSNAQYQLRQRPHAQHHWRHPHN